ncbi:MAG: 5-nucleotidase protein [Frankiales bacterium]|nr:5-nucleotidase protein [Frankiales bacterium]
MSHSSTRRLAGTALAVTAALSVGSLASPAVAQQAPGTVDLQIVGINDFHGHLDPGTAGAPSVAGVLGGAVKALRAANPNTVFVSAGDNIGASPFISSSQKDQPTLDVLNEMGLAVSAVGNHEFDRGYRDLADRVVPAADFPFLGANVEGETPNLRASHVVTTPSGVKVGFVGVVTQETGTLVSPAGIPRITFSDPVAAANTAADALSDGSTANGEADVVVLLAHEGAATGAVTTTSCATLAARDDAFGKIIRSTNANVDAILGGHTHLTVDCEVPLASGQVRPVLEAGEYGKAIDRLTLTWDRAARRVTAVNGEVLALSATTCDPDPAVEQIVRTAAARADEVGREVIGSITADISRAKTASGAEDRGTESLLGNFIADVQLGATSAPANGGAQIAFMNPGGLRADLVRAASPSGEAAGEITYAEAAVVQPFANTLFTLSLTGAQVKQVLEEQYQPDGSSRPFLALGVSKGLRYELQGTNPRGSRIQSITLNGTALDPAATYRIATNSFLASGGDNFRTLGTGTDRRDTGLDDLRVLVDFFRANSPVTPATEDRSVVLSLAAPAPAPTASPSPSATPTATASPSPSATPTVPVPAPFCAQAPVVTLGSSTIVATGSTPVTVSAAASQTVDLYAYTRPSTGYRLVRSGVTGQDGKVTFADPVRPPANTRLYAQVRGRTVDPARASVVLNVRTALSLFATRNGPRSYTFSGDSLPARKGGLIVSLYRVTSTGAQVLTAQTRASATTGEWTIDRTFTGTGRFGFVVRTGQDLQNAPGASNVRPTLVF